MEKSDLRPADSRRRLSSSSAAASEAGVPHEGVGHEHPLRPQRRELTQGERALGPGQDLVGHLGGRRVATLLLVALLAPAAPLASRIAPRAPGELPGRDGVALAGAIGRLVGRWRLDQVLEPQGVLGQAPLFQGEGRVLDHDDGPVRPRQLAVRGQLVGHRVLGNLPDVVEKALVDRDLGDLPEVEWLAFPLQHLDGCFGEGHESLRIP